jgi:hypothetical protein
VTERQVWAKRRVTVLHAVSTLALKTCGTIRLDNAAGEGQARFNKHFERDHEKYVKAKRNQENKYQLTEGLFVKLEPELREALLVAAMRGAKGLRKYHDDALKLQNDADLRQKQIEHQKKCENAREQYIQSWNYIDMYHNIQIDAGRMLQRHGKCVMS